MLGAALGVDSGGRGFCNDNDNPMTLDLSFICHQPTAFEDHSRNLGGGWCGKLAPALASSDALVFSLLCLGLLCRDLLRSQDRVSSD